jgi:hypothetical protein
MEELTSKLNTTCPEIPFTRLAWRVEKDGSCMTALVKTCSRGIVVAAISYEYDILTRPSRSFVSEGGNPEIVFKQKTYGEGLPDPEKITSVGGYIKVSIKQVSIQKSRTTSKEIHWRVSVSFGRSTNQR